jgi:hypothetical protein
MRSCWCWADFDFDFESANSSSDSIRTECGIAYPNCKSTNLFICRNDLLGLGMAKGQAVLYHSLSFAALHCIDELVVGWNWYDECMVDTTTLYGTNASKLR